MPPPTNAQLWADATADGVPRTPGIHFRDVPPSCSSLDPTTMITHYVNRHDVLGKGMFGIREWMPDIKGKSGAMRDFCPRENGEWFPEDEESCMLVRQFNTIWTEVQHLAREAERAKGLTVSNEEVMDIADYKDILPMNKAQDYMFDLRIGKPPGIHGDAMEFWLPFAQCGDPGRCRASDGAVILDKWSTSPGGQAQGLADRCREAIFNWVGSKTTTSQKEPKLPDPSADRHVPPV